MTRRQAVQAARKVADTLAFCDAWLTVFDSALTTYGLAYTGAACDCEHGGQEGHEPACGWDFVTTEVRNT